MGNFYYLKGSNKKKKHMYYHHWATVVRITTSQGYQLLSGANDL
jgi:hypothetical protein